MDVCMHVCMHVCERENVFVYLCVCEGVMYMYGSKDDAVQCVLSYPQPIIFRPCIRV